jgi:hypothetical protein
MSWWGWVLVGLGLVSVLAVIAITFHSQLMFAVSFAKTLTTDQRVPRPLHWLIGVSLAIKVVPFPDFGVDEIVLVIVGLVLVIFYRPALTAILERRDQPTPRQSDLRGQVSLNVNTQHPSNQYGYASPTAGCE